MHHGQPVGIIYMPSCLYLFVSSSRFANLSLEVVYIEEWALIQQRSEQSIAAVSVGVCVVALADSKNLSSSLLHHQRLPSCRDKTSHNEYILLDPLLSFITDDLRKCPRLASQSCSVPHYSGVSYCISSVLLIVVLSYRARCAALTPVYGRQRRSVAIVARILLHHTRLRCPLSAARSDSLGPRPSLPAGSLTAGDLRVHSSKTLLIGGFPCNLPVENVLEGYCYTNRSFSQTNAS